MEEVPNADREARADFFATNERQIALRKWMAADRPDIDLKPVKFSDVGAVTAALNPFLDMHPALAGLFAVWDVPAMEAVKVLRARARAVPMTTIDLGTEVAVALARGDIIKGVGAKLAYDQGVVVTKATIAALVGRDPPAWVVLPGLATTQETVADTYRRIWHEAPPPEILAGRGLGRYCINNVIILEQYCSDNRRRAGATSSMVESVNAALVLRIFTGGNSAVNEPSAATLQSVRISEALSPTIDSLNLMQPAA